MKKMIGTKVTVTSDYLSKLNRVYYIREADAGTAVMEVLGSLDKYYKYGDFGVEEDSDGELYIYSNYYTEKFDIRAGHELAWIECEEYTYRSED